MFTEPGQQACSLGKQGKHGDETLFTSGRHRRTLCSIAIVIGATVQSWAFAANGQVLPGLFAWHCERPGCLCTNSLQSTVNRHSPIATYQSPFTNRNLLGTDYSSSEGIEGDY